MRVGCVICGDLFVPSEDISATPCGHTFHSICLIQWIERSKSCPQCRHKATLKSLVKLFFDTSSADNGEQDPDTLQQQLDGQKFQVRLKDQEINKLKETSGTLTTQNRALREEYKSLERQLKVKESTVLALKTQLQFMDRITKEAQKAKDESKNLREQLKILQNVETVVSGLTRDVEVMLVSYSNNPDSTKALATFCSILKKELNKTIDDKKKLRDEVSLMRRKVKESRQNYDTVAKKLSTVEQINTNLNDDIKALERENTSAKKKVIALQEAVISPSGDVKNSALHRLIAESPAPAQLKRSQREDCFTVTPEVVRKMARTAEVEVDSDEDKLCIDLPSESKNQLNRRPLGDTSNKEVLSSSDHHNIFAKQRIRKRTNIGCSFQSSSNDNQVGYDGFGGHHKVEVFPKPNPLLKKKKGIRVVTKIGAASSVQTTTIKNYFQNTFDD
ncbi:hypothetical protein Pcinc_015700 [Petrolisthes cinctipes]|uniref:RING-type domain-containing protein n=1 Tax=Petrolisthes cinctipes TaxID=88211 RepID=A0AAE1KMU4_PETCI|nr:hypothetical protein Pcinc_015700 [Petrolisthes cinctipes]